MIFVCRFPGSSPTSCNPSENHFTNIPFGNLFTHLLLILARSPMAQAYLEYLMALHPILATSFSRVLSAGLAASKPGVPLPPGVEFMLRDYGINTDFSHTSRRLERRDVEKFEYVLTMSRAQREEILSRWPSRSDVSSSELTDEGQIFREDLETKVKLLGDFGNQGGREVSMAESINQAHWFHIGTKRIYPGYDTCFGEIKAYIADFVYDVTGFDVHAKAMSSSQELDSRDVSTSGSDDEALAFRSPNWTFHEDRPGFEVLRRDITRCKCVIYCL